jgi:hypothetical protein
LKLSKERRKQIQKMKIENENYPPQAFTQIGTDQRNRLRREDYEARSA